MATKSSGDKPAKLRIKMSNRSGESGAAQVARQIRELIEGGRLQAGEMMPSEDGLAEQLGVGRKIVRGAYAKLVEEGHLLSDFPRNKRVAGKKAGGKGSKAGAAKSGGKATKKSAKKR
jgi:DNA-binding transcriptional regulator YhcF (GntR family)